MADREPSLQNKGAEFVAWEGRLWADHFGDPVGEHHAVRGGVGVWDLSPLRKWEFRGRDAVHAADHIFTHDIGALEPGQVRYSPFCDADGQMVGDATVFKVAEGLLWSFTARDGDGEHFREAATGYDVAIRSFTEELSCVQVQGPGSRRFLSRFVPDVVHLQYFRFWPEPVSLAGAPCWVARIGYSGELGFELFCQSHQREGLWDALISAGGTPYGLAAAETLRIEAGLILIGREYAPPQSSPYDVSLDALVRLDKHAFVGREALRAIAASPPRRLMTIVVDGEAVSPPAGTSVGKKGSTVGVVTSSCLSPSYGAVLALAVVDRDAAEDGGSVALGVADGPLPGTMRMAPMHDPDRTRARR